jgi:oligopeptidase B
MDTHAGVVIVGYEHIARTIVMTHSITTRRHLLASAVAVVATATTPVFAKKMKSRKKPPMPQSSLPVPPVAKRFPHSFTAHGYTIEDPYFWLKDQGYPKIDDKPVLDYVKAENTYFEAVMKPQEALIEKIFGELKGRVKQDDTSVPQKDGNYLYQSKFETGGQYPKIIRWPINDAKAVQVLLDQPEMAKGKEYFRVGGSEVSHDGALLAYAVDTNGSERYTTRIKNIATGTLLSDTLEQTNGNLVWQSDNKAFAYMELSQEWRPYRVKYHVLGTDPSSDKLLYEEKDSGFFAGIDVTSSKKFMIIQTGDNITSEIQLIPLDNLLAKPVMVSPRRVAHEYSLDEREGIIYIRTNDKHRNFRIATAPSTTPEEKNWQELIAGTEKHFIRGATSHKNVLVVSERIDGLDQVRLRTYDGNESYIKLPEASYSASVSGSPEYEIDHVRLNYSSMVTPNTVYDYDMAVKRLSPRKVQEIPSGYDPSLYVTERLLAPARDGTMVPVSVVYRKDRGKNAGPLHLYVYGSYGYAVPPGFSSTRLSLLDRGFAYAIAHVRGGDDLGYDWYTQGKAKKRWNTFNDFIDTAKFLIAQGYTAEKNISAEGGSAGGQVMGTITNTANELWRAVIAEVPFVDVINTMMDMSLPLTPTEWPEWGNPIKNKDDFDYMKSYSAYDNVDAKPYPHLMVTAGLNDPRVTYWEPAKWVAKLRHTKTNDNMLVLKTNMGAGHGGQSGRFNALKETAEQFVFLLKAYGLADKG